METLVEDKYGIEEMLNVLGIKEENFGSSTGTKFFGDGELISSFSPVDGKLIGKVHTTTPEEYEKIIQKSVDAFKKWRNVPAPKRGEIVRQLGDKLREFKEPLGKLVSYEMGKSLQEGMGEVQEMIDICDFAVGLSRQLYGLTMHSERPEHRMYEQWYPLGTVGVITSFNFPVAVWAWNAALAFVAGDTILWKPSEKAPLCGVATQKLMADILADNNLPEGISNLVVGDYKIGELMTNDKRVPLISATGSIRMGKIVAQKVAARLGNSLLELGGNNAIILTPEADIEMAIVGTLFGAVGTAGQRCTSTRRLIIHESIYDKVKDILVNAYGQLKIGNPLDENNHVGPIIDTTAVDLYKNAIKKAVEEGGNVLVGDKVLEGEEYSSGCYVLPTIVEAENEYSIVQDETFAPILYLIKYKELDEAIAMQNGVVQGLSSAIFTNNMRDAEKFLSVNGSDCGIANVNIGTSGAEIGGAFGGEKETGGGRESGSDAWKVYMRRQTNTINFSPELPLAQGIKFDIEI
jgi:aldehyde dehydrogenase (NAD+)